MAIKLPIEEQNIIKILGLEALPDERKIALVQKITDLVQKRLLVRVFDALPQTKQKELAGLLDQDNPDALSGFLGQNVPELAEWAMEETGKVKSELAGLVE